MAIARAYKGPVCFVGQDHDAADGRPLQGGWHYTVVEGPDGVDMPGERLVLEEGHYRLAKTGDRSHQERHHRQLVIVAPAGGVGDPRTDEEYAATHRHLDQLEQRLDREGLHPHEHDHILRSPEEIRVMRRWLEQAREEQA